MLCIFLYILLGGKEVFAELWSFWRSSVAGVARKMVEHEAAPTFDTTRFLSTCNERATIEKSFGEIVSRARIQIKNNDEEEGKN
jgi:hypothetical protein